MPKVTLYNMSGEAAGEIELNDSVFGVPYNEAVIHQAIVRQLSNQRLGTMPRRQEVLCAAGERNRGNRREQAVPEQGPSVPHYGSEAGLYSDRSREAMSRACPAKHAAWQSDLH